MAINSELLNESEVLKGLSDEQKSAIVTLSENEQRKSFDQKFLEILSGIDETVKSVTGKGKNTNEKTTEYVKRSISEQIEHTDSLVKEYDAKMAELKEQIAKGGDIDSIVSKKDSEIESVKKEYMALKAEFDTFRDQSAKELSKSRIDGAFNAAINGINFVDMNQSTLDAVKSQVLESLHKMNPSFETIDGKEAIVFHDENGVVMLNKKKNLTAFSVADMVRDTFDKYGVIAEESAKSGNGGRGGRPAGTKVFSGASTKTEATSLIQGELAKKGLVRGTEAYDKAYKEICDCEEYRQLPLM